MWRKKSIKLASDYRSFKILTNFEIGLHHTQGETLQTFFSLISNMHTLKDLKMMANHTLQDIIQIITPEGAMHVISCYLMGNMETEVVQQLAVLTFCSKKKHKQKARVWMRKRLWRPSRWVFYSSARTGGGGEGRGQLCY